MRLLHLSSTEHTTESIIRNTCDTEHSVLEYLHTKVYFDLTSQTQLIKRIWVMHDQTFDWYNPFWLVLVCLWLQKEQERKGEWKERGERVLGCKIYVLPSISLCCHLCSIKSPIKHCYCWERSPLQLDSSFIRESVTEMAAFRGRGSAGQMCSDHRVQSGQIFLPCCPSRPEIEYNMVFSMMKYVQHE